MLESLKDYIVNVADSIALEYALKYNRGETESLVIKLLEQNEAEVRDKGLASMARVHYDLQVGLRLPDHSFKDYSYLRSKSLDELEPEIKEKELNRAKMICSE